MASIEKQKRKPRLEIFLGGRALKWRQKLSLFPVRLAAGGYPGPLLVTFYRKDILGKEFMKALNLAMRDSAHWTKAELELFATFTANQLACDF